ncbi:hypothetical protein O3P69_014402 [Scylla paramamosain]|uniref:FACT complex subunit n=1 Tax=Scylla paramamosain TaxID=85552 RepID=A0AAW0TC27_SCYPA
MEAPFNAKRVRDDIVNVKLEWFMLIAVLVLFLDDKKDKFTATLLKDDTAEENVPVLFTNVVEGLSHWLLVQKRTRRILYNWPEELSEETESRSGNRVTLESELVSSLVDRFVICRRDEDHPILLFANDSNRTLRHRISSTKAEFLKSLLNELKNEAMYGTQWLIKGGGKESSSAKKKGGDVAGLGVDGGNNDLLLQTMGGAGGSTGGCGSGNDGKKDDMEDKFSLKIKQTIEDKDPHIKSMLHAVLSSRLSESNNDRSAGSIAPCSTPSEGLLEYFDREGVSVDIGAAKDYTDKVNGTLYFRFHIHHLACIQLNIFHYFFNRAYADVVNFGITCTGVSEVRVNPKKSTHWSSMEVKHIVMSEHMEKCFAYLETKFTDAYTKLMKCTTLPNKFKVEFEVWDSCVGLYTSVPAIRGPQCLEMYSYGGKNQKKV